MKLAHFQLELRVRLLQRMCRLGKGKERICQLFSNLQRSLYLDHWRGPGYSLPGTRYISHRATSQCNSRAKRKTDLLEFYHLTVIREGLKVIRAKFKFVPRKYAGPLDHVLKLPHVSLPG